MSKQDNIEPWGAEEKLYWLSEQKIKRSYHEQVERKIKALGDDFDVQQYGVLHYSPNEYPLYTVKSLQWEESKKTILITGGVHGYETSGVQGALQFISEKLLEYTAHFNIIVLPCISPWGYETINRWNPNAVDPNRSFFKNSVSEEASLAMNVVLSMDAKIFAHFDLHETTDTDNTEFRPALEARDAVEQEVWNIPDGFYLVGDSENPQEAFQKAIIQSVEKVTHIAPTDEFGKIIGMSCSQQGVIHYDVKKLGLCTGFAGARFTTTTEVYPDSAKVDDQNCIDAQVAAVRGGLDFLININPLIDKAISGV